MHLHHFIFILEATFGSFERQLHSYGFRRVLKGPTSGAFHHPLFIQGRYDLAMTINRVATRRSASSGASTVSSLTVSDTEEPTRGQESSKRIREEMVTTPTDELISVLLNQMYTNTHGHASGEGRHSSMEDPRFSELFVYKDASRGSEIMHSHSKASDTTGGSDDSSDPFELLQCHTDRGSDADSYFQYTESGDSASRASPPTDPNSYHLAPNTRRRKNASNKQKQKSAHVSKKGQKSPRTPKDNYNYSHQDTSILEITLDPSILSQYGEIYYVPSDGGCPVRIKAVNVPTIAYTDSVPLSARSANTATTGATTARDSTTAGSEPSSAHHSPSQGKSNFHSLDMIDHSESMHGLMDSQSLFHVPSTDYQE